MAPTTDGLVDGRWHPVVVGIVDGIGRPCASWRGGGGGGGTWPGPMRPRRFDLVGIAPRAKFVAGLHPSTVRLDELPEKLPRAMRCMAALFAPRRVDGVFTDFTDVTVAG